VKIASVCSSIIGFLGIVGSTGLMSQRLCGMDKQNSRSPPANIRVTVGARRPKHQLQASERPDGIDFRGTPSAVARFPRAARVESRQGRHTHPSAN